MIKLISFFGASLILLTICFIPKPVQALDCAPVPAEEAIAQTGTILQARITDIVYADGTKYGTAGYREDPVYMRAEVSRVWRGRASATEVIVFTDPEWGGVPRVAQDYIFYLSRSDTVLSTGNCVRLRLADTEEVQLIETLLGDPMDAIPGEAALVTTYFPADVGDNNALQPIAIGPGLDSSQSITSAGSVPFNLLCLLLMVVIASGGSLMKNRGFKGTLVKSDPGKQ